MARRWLKHLTLSALLACGAAASAQPAGPAPTFSASQGDTLAAGRAVGAPALAHIAREQGSVNVIVMLDLGQPPALEPRLSPAAVSQQRALIAQTQGALQTELAGTQSTIQRQYQTLPAVAATVDEAGLEALARSTHVRHIGPDNVSAPSLTDSVPLIGAPAVWAQGNDGTGQAVAIIDTGIDGSHPFFKNPANASRIVAQACFSGAMTSSDSLCPNGARTQIGMGAAEAKIPACNGGSLCAHGTHVAGIAAGYSATMKGVAPNASIIAIQVFSRVNDSAACGGSAPCLRARDSDILAGLDHVNATLRGQYAIAAVNMSLSGGGYTTYCDSSSPVIQIAIDNLRAAGIATTVASGNDGRVNAMGHPACVSAAIAVGSTTKTDTVSSFSNIASMMALLAPGSAINSSVPGGGYQSMNGTSMAAPHVAGAWALLKQAQPAASVSRVLSALATTGVAITDQRTGGSITAPRIQVDAARTALLAAPTYTVTPSVGTPSGAVSPGSAQTVVAGGRIVFALEPGAGYAADGVTGTCPGTLVAGRWFRVGPVMANCTVVAHFKPMPLLYDQTANTFSGSVVAFERTDATAYSAEAADDFVVPAGQTWRVEQVRANGLYEGALAPTTAAKVTIYADAGGQPGAVVASHANLVPEDVSGSLTLALPGAGLVLPAGTYWLSVQPRRSYSADGPWYWGYGSGGSHAAYRWRNPGNGFGTGCTNWSVGSVCIDDPGNDGLNFMLFGRKSSADGNTIFTDRFEN